MTSEVSYRAMSGTIRPVLKKIQSVKQMWKGGFNLSGIHGEKVIVVGGKEINTRGGEIKIVAEVFDEGRITLPSRFIYGGAVINVEVRADKGDVFTAEHIEGVFALTRAFEMKVDGVRGFKI